jgi:amidase
LQAHPPPDYRQFLQPDALKGVRIGVMRQNAGFSEEVDIQLQRAIKTLRAQGAVVLDPANIPTQGKFDSEEQAVLLFEFKDGLNRYLAQRGAGPRNLAELIAYNTREKVREMPIFGQELFVNAQAKGPLNTPGYLEARERARRLAGAEGIDAALARDHLDALIAPTMGPAWTTDWVNGDHFVGGGTSSAPAVAGYPHVTVPMGFVRGLPVGLSFVASAWSEPRLIAYAYAFEQATHARHPPHFATRSP